MKVPANSALRCRNKSRRSGQLPIPPRQKPAWDIRVWRQQPDIFTREDHLRVQQQIEVRAHSLWLADGKRMGQALNNWTRAESEVLAAFIQSRLRPAQTSRI